MDGDDAFSAALILVMVVIAFPPTSREHEAMTQALEVLRGMADRGNSHIRARRQSLLSLQTIFNKVPPAHPASTPVLSALEASVDPPLSGTGQERTSGGVFTDWGDLGTADIALGSVVDAQGNGNGDGSGSGVAGLFPSPDPFAEFNPPFSAPGATTEDMSLWERTYGNFDIGMYFDWTEAARIAKGYGEDGGGVSRGRDDRYI